MRFSSARLEQKLLSPGRWALETGPVVQWMAFPRMPLCELFHKLVGNKLRAAASVAVAELSVVGMIAMLESVIAVAVGLELVQVVVLLGLVEGAG